MQRNLLLNVKLTLVIWTPNESFDILLALRSNFSSGSHQSLELSDSNELNHLISLWFLGRLGPWCVPARPQFGIHYMPHLRAPSTGFC